MNKSLSRYKGEKSKWYGWGQNRLKTVENGSKGPRKAPDPLLGGKQLAENSFYYKTNISVTYIRT